MMDPGHGGLDYGVKSRDGQIYEIDINLSIVRIFRNIAYMTDYPFDAYTTRHEDKFIPLWNRVDLAKFWNVHAFMSIHCNAREAIGKDGLEIEVFHAVGSEKGRNFANLALGCLLCEARKKTAVISRGVKEKDFYVLKRTHCPAILVELGFISDPEEAEFLNDKKNQRIMAKALIEATQLYFESGAVR